VPRRAHVAAIKDADIAALSPRYALLASAAAAIAAPQQEALPLYQQALAIPRSDRWAFEHARVQLSYGQRLRRAQAIAEARPPLTAALTTFERLRARPWVTRAASELRATGQTKPRRPGDQDKPLTPQELTVATLAASGLTNKEIAARLFLSDRTVGGHLHRAFPKLGITTRAALRDALASTPQPDHQRHNDQFRTQLKRPSDAGPTVRRASARYGHGGSSPSRTFQIPMSYRFQACSLTRAEPMPVPPTAFVPGNGLDSEHGMECPSASTAFVLLLLHDFPDPGKFHRFACSSPLGQVKFP
jgi:DNA-binding CsgD family transcriptional regulator